MSSWAAILLIPLILTLFHRPLSHGSSIATPARHGRSDLNEDIETLFKDYLHWMLSIDPQFAFRRGFTEYRGRGLPKIGMEEIAEHERECPEFQERALRILERGQDDEEEVGGDPFKLHYVKVIERNARSCFKESSFHGYAFPPITIIQSFLPGLFHGYTAMFKKITDQEILDQALADLADIPNYFDKVMGQLQNGVSRNLTYNEISVRNFRPALDEVIGTSFEDSVLSKPFKNGSELVTESVQAQAKTIYDEELIPKVRELADYFTDVYTKHLRQGPGLSWLGEAGIEFYKACLRIFNNNETPDVKALHWAGLDGIKRIKENTKNIIRELGLDEKMSFKEFSAHARDNAVPLKDGEELLEVLGNLTEDINSRLTQILPDKYLTEEFMGLNIKKSAGNVPLPVYFVPGSLDGTQLGTFFINTENPNVFRRYELPTITLHEANPGHNFADRVNSEQDVPVFMKVDPAYFPPALFVPRTAYTEGWGLYSEALGPLIGLYEGKPMDLFGYYGGDLLRSVIFLFIFYFIF